MNKKYKNRIGKSFHKNPFEMIDFILNNLKRENEILKTNINKLVNKIYEKERIILKLNKEIKKLKEINIYKGEIKNV